MGRSMGKKSWEEILGRSPGKKNLLRNPGNESLEKILGKVLGLKLGKKFWEKILGIGKKSSKININVPTYLEYLKNSNQLW